MRGHRGDVSLMIAIGVAMIVAIAFTASRFMLSGRVKREAAVVDSIESFGTNEIAAWHVYYKKLADATLPEGLVPLPLSNAMDFDISTLPNQTVSASSPDNTPFNVKTTLNFDSEKTLVRRLASQDFSYNLKTTGDATNYCGEIRPKGSKRGFSACLSMPVPTGCGNVNACGGIEMCPGALNTMSPIPISTRDDLQNMQSGKRYRLANHIDFAGGPLVQITDLHDIYLDGNNFEIRNATVNSYASTGNLGMVGRLGNAVIRNLTFKNISVNVEWGVTFGLIAAETNKNLCIDRVRLENVNVTSSNPSYHPNTAATGGLVGRVLPDVDLTQSPDTDEYLQATISSSSPAPTVVFNPQKVTVQDSSVSISLVDRRSDCNAGASLGTSGVLRRATGGYFGMAAPLNLQMLRNSLSGTVSGVIYVGGAVGLLYPMAGALIENFTASNLTVEGVSPCSPTGGASSLGGLVGASHYGPNPLRIRGSSTTNTTVRSVGVQLGGLVGGQFNSNSTALGSYQGVNWGSSVGPLVPGVEIENSSTAGSVQAMAGGGGERMGGLVGEGFVVIRNSSSSANVTGTREIGGLVGTLLGSANSSATALIELSHATGAVTLALASDPAATTSATKVEFAGGLVGMVNSAPGLMSAGTPAHTQVQITQSYATGNVTSKLTPPIGSSGYQSSGGSWALGGLVGYLMAVMGPIKFENSYSTGNVSGYHAVGGMIGWLSYSPSVVELTKVFTTSKAQTIRSGAVAAYLQGPGGQSTPLTFGVKPIVGLKTSGPTSWVPSTESVTVQSAYWDTDKSGVTSSPEGVGMTTTQMSNKNNFSGYDFQNIWKTPTGGNPPTLK